MFDNKLRTLVAGALLLAASSASAVPLLVDINDRATTDSSTTQAGFTGGVNLNGGVVGGSNISFAAVGDVDLNDRDRGAGANTSGGSSFDDMFRDFAFVDERSNSPTDPAGVDILIDNLLANTLYDVRLWAFDIESTTQRNMTWNGVSYGFDGSDPNPFDLDDNAVMFQVTTDATGLATLQGRIDFAQAGPCCNVFANGFALNQATVPAPGVAALLLGGLIGLRISRRRRS